MLPEIPPEELAAALDACAEQSLWEAGVTSPPIDAFDLAERLDILIVSNHELTHRAQFARLADHDRVGENQAAIVVGPAERPERAQWAVAHEIGECIAYRVIESLGIKPEAAPPETRERVANQLACCLLLPRIWFLADARAANWMLPALKQRYLSASHELIARRMLDMPPPVVITVCDLGGVHWRRSNTTTRVPSMLPIERETWQRCHVTGRPTFAALDPETTGLENLRCWPIHEPDWKREIMRSEIVDL